MTSPRPAASPNSLLLAVSAAATPAMVGVWVWTATDDSRDTDAWIANTVLVWVAAAGLVLSGIGFALALAGARRLPATAEWLLVAAPLVLAVVIAGYLDATYTPPAPVHIPVPDGRKPFSGHPESGTVMATGLLTTGCMALVLLRATRLRRQTASPRPAAVTAAP